MKKKKKKKKVTKKSLPPKINGKKTITEDKITIPKRIARRTRNGSSKKVAFGGKGVTIFPDFRSAMPAMTKQRP